MMEKKTKHTAWDPNVLLSDSQREAVAFFAELVSERPLSSHLPKCARQDEFGVEHSQMADDSARDAVQGTLPVMRDAQDFRNWLSKIELEIQQREDQKFVNYLETLKGHKEGCDVILQEVAKALALLSELNNQHHVVSDRTSTLRSECESFLREQLHLEELLANIYGRLTYFDEADRLAGQFNSPSFTLSHPNFVPTLSRLDECIAYVTTNSHFRDSALYKAKFHQLLIRALTVIKNHVTTTIRSSTQSILDAPKDASTSPDPSKVDASIVYVKFRTPAQGLRELLNELAMRVSDSEVSTMLEECMQFYFSQRRLLVGTAAYHRLLSFAQSGDLLYLIRHGCVYLSDTCHQEYQLFHSFFPPSPLNETFSELVSSFSDTLSDYVRSMAIKCTSIELLCEVIDVFKTEILEEIIDRRGPSVACLRDLILRIVQDVQERLVFCAETYIRDEIQFFSPTKEQLAYPELLKAIHDRRQQRRASTSNAINAGAHLDVKSEEASPAKVLDGESGFSEIEEAEAAAMLGEDGATPVDSPLSGEDGLFIGCYPILERTLACLSRLYRSLETSVFEGLAQEAVLVCRDGLSAAAQTVTKAKGQTDGSLFLIKHLLLLREQIAPFDINFAVTEKNLDFTNTRDAWAHAMRNRANIFKFSSENMFLELLSHGQPRLAEVSVDSKKDLERQLKTVCEAFILQCTHTLIDPLWDFVDKARSFLAMRQAKGSNTASSSDNLSIRSQKFAQPERIKEILAKVDTALSQTFPALFASMRLYITNEHTCGILLKPIKTNIIDAYTQLNVSLGSEYTEEELSQFGEIRVEHISRRLDSLA